MNADDSHYLRNLDAVATGTVRRYLFTTPEGVTHVFQNVDGELVSAVWEALSTPISHDKWTALLENESGGLTSMFQKLLENDLVWRGAREDLMARRARAERPSSPMPCRQLLLGVSGGVQTATIATYVERLLTSFATDLDVILTESAQRFVTATALTAIGARVWCDPWEIRDDVRVPHVHLAQRAELVLVLPATAHTIARLAQGMCSDLLSLTVTATRAPVVVVPSMNTAMWRNPAVGRNVTLLRRNGVFVVDPALGYEVSKQNTNTVDVGAAGLDPFSPSMLGMLEAVLRL